MNIPETHTLTLMKNTVTSGTGMGQSIATSTVQTLAGSLQPISQREINQYGKETEIWDWKFYVNQSKFTSSANEAELKPSNYMTQTSPSRTFDIVGIGDWTASGGYYKVLLRQQK